jgi:hypothetical protein
MARSFRTSDRTQAHRCKGACASREIVSETFDVDGVPVHVRGQIKSMIYFKDSNIKNWIVTFVQATAQ